MSFCGQSQNMIRIVLFLAFSSIALLSIAQNSKGTISVLIQNQQQKALEGATVLLLRAKDSALAKTAVSSVEGKAELNNVTPGTYLLKVSMAGYAMHISSPFDVTRG